MISREDAGLCLYIYWWMIMIMKVAVDRFQRMDKIRPKLCSDEARFVGAEVASSHEAAATGVMKALIALTASPSWERRSSVALFLVRSSSSTCVCLLARVCYLANLPGRTRKVTSSLAIFTFFFTSASFFGSTFLPALSVFFPWPLTTSSLDIALPKAS